MTVADILCLPGWEVRSTEEKDDHLAIEASVIEVSSACPLCGNVTRPSHFGYRPRTFFDLPIRMRPVRLTARRRRYQCKECSGTFLDPLSGIDERYEATERLVHYIQEQALYPTRTFASLANMVGVSEAFVRKIFLAHIEHLERTYVIETPRYLGIDEIVIDAPWCVLTDLERHCIIDVLEKRDMVTVKRWLTQLPCLQTVEVVVMDHWNPYRLSVHEALPHAKIILDKFHVVRQVNEVVETVRKSIRASLSPQQQRQLKQDHRILQKREKDLTPAQRLIVESWMGFVPVLKELLQLKEAFYGIYDARSEQDAYDRYVAWQASIPPTLSEAFLPLQLTMEEWGQEVFAYFSTATPLTNGFTEAQNRLIRDASRTGFGLGFRTLRAKLLFGAANTSPARHQQHVSQPAFQPQEVGVQ